MRISVISFTEKGRKLSFEIKSALNDHEVSRYCFYSHSDEDAEHFSDTGVLTETLFRNYDALIFVCACGIAVRAIAPNIRSKTTDPAVIAADDCGKFVISLLSGHIGGANRLTEIISEKINAVPVITTATDTGGKFSPDSFAKANDLVITDMDAAKKIASSVLEDRKIGIHSVYQMKNIPAQLSETEKCSCGIVISDSVADPLFDTTLFLIPRNIVLGIGCKRGTDAETIEKMIMGWLYENKIMPERVKYLTSVDLKKNEPGINGFCRKYGIEFITFTAEQLMSVKGDFTASDFVKSVTGADNICERSAVLASGGELIMRKHSGNGVTCAVAEMPVIIDFERKIL